MKLKPAWNKLLFAWRRKRRRRRRKAEQRDALNFLIFQRTFIASLRWIFLHHIRALVPSLDTTQRREKQARVAKQQSHLCCQWQFHHHRLECHSDFRYSVSSLLLCVVWLSGGWWWWDVISRCSLDNLTFFIANNSLQSLVLCLTVTFLSFFSSSFQISIAFEMYAL